MSKLSQAVLTLAAVLSGVGLVRCQWVPIGPPSIFSSLAKTSSRLYVGSRGNGISMSTDNGATWQDSHAGLTDHDITSLTCIGANVYAGSMGSGVFVTSDNGATWNASNSFLISNNIACIAAFGDTLLAGPVGFGAFTSTNSGETWLPAGKGLGLGTVNTFFRIDSVILAGTMDGVYRTFDRGKNWAVSNGGLPEHSVVEAFSSIGGTAFVAVLGDGIYSSADFGTSWRKLVGGLQLQDISSLAAIPTQGTAPKKLFAGSASHGLVASTDAGSTWATVDIPLSSNLVGALMASDSEIYVALGEGVRSSNSGGITWNNAGVGLPNSEETGLESVEGKLVVGTRFSGAYRSTDKGMTWIRNNVGLSNNEITAMTVRGTEIFVGTTGGSIFRQDVADSTWTIGGNELANLGINALGISGQTLLAGPGLRGVYYSPDDGLNWTFAQGSIANVSGTKITAFRSDQGHVYAGSLSYGMFRSIDNGKSWTQLNAGLGSLDISSIAVTDSLVFAGTAAGLFRSRDHGDTWETQFFGPGNIPVSNLATIGKVIIAGTDGRGVFVSTNQGVEWRNANQGTPPLNVRVLFTDGVDVYAGNTLGGLARRSFAEMLSNATSANTRGIQPHAFQLFQNYPNPFNPTTRIRYTVGRVVVPSGAILSGAEGPASTNVRLAVYDVLGREVAVLVNERQLAGTHEVKFDGQKLASGVFFVRLTAAGFVATRSMILLK